MEQHRSENRYQPTSGSLRMPDSEPLRRSATPTTAASEQTPRAATVHTATPAVVPTLASASLPSSVQKFMPPHLRDPFLDQPNYAHALITPEYDATIIHSSPEDQARAQVQGLNNRISNAKFHVRMTLVMLLLLVGPFSVGVILAMFDMHTDAVAGVVVLGWVMAIVLTPIWIMMGATRRSAARARRTYGQAPIRKPTPFHATY